MTQQLPLISALSVAAGGSIGAASRWLVSSQAIAALPVEWPVATFFVNLTGSFALGFMHTWLPGTEASPYLSLMLTTGFLGAFTTFSTFSLESVHLLESRGPIATAAYVLASVSLGLAFAWCGSRLGMRLH